MKNYEKLMKTYKKLWKTIKNYEKHDFEAPGGQVQISFKFY